MVLVDGGVFDNLGLSQGVELCRSQGHSDKDIIVDMILINDTPLSVKKWTLEEARLKSA